MLGTWMTPSSRRIIDSEEASPRIAEMIGRPIAVAVPKEIRRMITAAPMPTTSLSLVEGCESCEPT
jgi:hypothetical protein